MEIRKAIRRGLRGRIALCGPTGSGKSYTALKLAEVLGKKIGVIDSEYGSAKIYADVASFDVIELYDYTPNNYLEAIRSFENGGYDVLIIDSFSHAWSGKGGILDQADLAAKKMRNPNSYVAWKEATPLHDELITAIKSYHGHVIVTMRSKMDYQQEKQGDKTVIRKLGMAPVQREGTEYEFDIVCDMDVDHNLIVGKTRCSEIDGMVVKKPDGKFAKIILDWLNSGELSEETEPLATEAQCDEIVKLSQSHVVPPEVASALDAWESSTGQTAASAKLWIDRLKALPDKPKTYDPKTFNHDKVLAYIIRNFTKAYDNDFAQKAAIKKYTGGTPYLDATDEQLFNLGAAVKRHVDEKKG